MAVIQVRILTGALLWLMVVFLISNVNQAPYVMLSIGELAG